MQKQNFYDVPNLEKQKILITGGLGFIGSNLAKKCLELGADVTIYDCLDPKSGGNIYNINEIRSEVKVILNDIRNFEGVSAAILNQNVVFNCAAYTSHPNSMKEPLIDIEVNCKGTINILEAAKRFNPESKIVHIGTSTQIGKMRFDEADELHPEFPVDIYSANKTASEKYVLVYGSAYKMRTTVIRLANNYGPRSNIKSPDFGFINYFIGLALQNKEITIFGKGSQLRNFSFVDDSVLALILASQNERSNGQVYFAVSDKQVSILDISNELVSIIGGKLRFIDWPKERESIEIGDAIIKNNKIKNELGWFPKTDIKEGMQQTKNYYKNCLTKYI